MNNLRPIMVITCLIFLGACLEPALAQETSEDLSPKVVDGEFIYAPGFPVGEPFFIRSREQEDLLGYVLENVVSITVYNDLGESYDEVRQDLLLRDREIEKLKNTLQTTWLVMGAIVVGLVGGIVFIGALQ